jgi:hypothetical protein
MGRAVDRRVTAAVSSMRNHVAVYLAVVEEPSSRSPSLFVQELGRAAHRGVAWCRVARAPSESCVGLEESGPDGVPRDGPGRGPQGHGRCALDASRWEAMSRCIWQWPRGRRHGHRVGTCKSQTELRTAV